MPNYVKVFGKQRSGTFFTSKLISANLQDINSAAHHGSKHNVVQDVDGMYRRFKKMGNPKNEPLFWDAIDKGIYAVVVIKNPYSWYKSIKKYYNFSFTVAEACTSYNYVHKSWKNLLENPPTHFRKGYLVRYEDLLVNEKKVITEIANCFSIPVKKKFVIPTKIPQSPAPFTKARKEFYLSGGTFGLPKNTVKEINKAIDWDLMTYYGYNKEEIGK